MGYHVIYVVKKMQRKICGFISMYKQISKLGLFNNYDFENKHFCENLHYNSCIVNSRWEEFSRENRSSHHTRNGQDICTC
jgi:hypothetical protein